MTTPSVCFFLGSGETPAEGHPRNKTGVPGRAETPDLACFRWREIYPSRQRYSEGEAHGKLNLSFPNQRIARGGGS